MSDLFDLLYAPSEESLTANSLTWLLRCDVESVRHTEARYHRANLEREGRMGGREREREKECSPRQATTVSRILRSTLPYLLSSRISAPQVNHTAPSARGNGLATKFELAGKKGNVPVIHIHKVCKGEKKRPRVSLYLSAA